MSDPIKCNVLPISNDELVVVPTSIIAEVITERQDLLVMGARDGLIGKMQWRGLSLPLIAFEAAIGKAVPSYGEAVRIVVLSSANADPDLPYFAMMVQGVARLVHLKETDFKAREEPDTSPFIAAHVEYAGASTYVPNFEHIESFLKTKVL